MLFTCDEIVSHELRVLQPDDDAAASRGDGDGDDVDAGLPLLEECAALKVVHHNEVRRRLVHLLQREQGEKSDSRQHDTTLRRSLGDRKAIH